MFDCSSYRTNLAAQTPVYDEVFLEDWKPLDSPITGRHLTEVWKQGTGATHFSDRIEIGQPDLTHNWQIIDSAECEDACSPPRVNVAFGTTRDSHNMQQFQLQSNLFCLTELRYNTRPAEQIAKIMRGLKKMPTMYTTDFLRVHAVDKAPIVYIAGSAFGEFVPDILPPGNISGQLTTVDLGGTGNLPTSELTFTYLDYISTGLELEGYSENPSGLPNGMFNLITDKRAWFKLTNGNPSMKDMMALGHPQDASPLYKIGQGIQKPFGNYAITLDSQPIRFQHMGNGVLNRVFPYYNVVTTTGIKRVKNPAYINARYQLSFLWHPRAIKLWTADFKKMHEKVPSVNSAMFGQWVFKNGDVLMYQAPDGTVCTKNNDNNDLFYWTTRFELGFQYVDPQLMAPILHLVDGSGHNCMVDSPICGAESQYVAQITSDSGILCET